MKRLLKKLPHIRRDSISDKRQSSQPKPNKTASSPTASTILCDADDAHNTDPTIMVSNGQPKIAQSDDAALDKRHSQLSKDAALHTLSEPTKRQSGLVSYDQPVETSSLHSDANIAKTKAIEPGLQLGPQDTSLSDDLSYLTLGGDSRDAVDPSRKRYSEDVADRNVLAPERGRLSERRGSVFHVPAQVDEFSEDVANRNIHSPPRSNSREASQASPPRKIKPDRVPLGHHVNADSGYLGQFESSGSSSDDRGAATATRTQESLQRSGQVLQGRPSTGAPKTEFKDLDFNDSEDIDYHTRYAPAVTHETVIPETRHIEEQVVTREIHNHDVHHRILPIKDVEVLPAKHFVRDPNTGALTEIPAPNPARAGGHPQWKLLTTDSDSGWQPAAPRAFTARTFGKDEGMEKEYVGQDGVPRTETTWIHPPTIQERGYQTGQTEALFMDELNDAKSKRKTNGLPGGRSDGVQERDGQICNGNRYGPIKEEKVRRHLVGSGVEH
ncbi:alcohol dehydrogenase [Venturia nashicola]|nr:alcohol dehydrogenase [Venturia nashicola]